MAINYPTPTTMQAVASLVFMVLITSPNAVLSSRAFLDTSATGQEDVGVTRWLPRSPPPAPKANDNPIEPPPIRKEEVGLTRLPRSPPPAPRANDNPIEPPPTLQEVGLTRLPRSPPPAPKANDNLIEPPPRNEEVGLTRLPRRSPPAPKANTPIFSPPRTLLP